MPKISELPEASELPKTNEIIVPVVLDLTKQSAYLANYKVSIAKLAELIVKDVLLGQEVEMIQTEKGIKFYKNEKTCIKQNYLEKLTENGVFNEKELKQAN